MRREERFGEALREAARRAAEVRILARRLSTRQARWADEAVEAVSSGAVSEAAALTTASETGQTVKYFMVGKDGFLPEESWVLG